MKTWPSTLARNCRSWSALDLTVVTGRTGCPAVLVPRSSSWRCTSCFIFGLIENILYPPIFFSRSEETTSTVLAYLQAICEFVMPADAGIQVPSVKSKRLDSLNSQTKCNTFCIRCCDGTEV